MAKSVRPQIAPKLNGHAKSPAPAAGKKGKPASSDAFLADDFSDDHHDDFPPVDEQSEEVEVVDEHGDDTVVDATDDPVRMYLMQMGEIPLLNRVEEISSAKKIEKARVKYRHSMLATDYVLQGAAEALEK